MATLQTALQERTRRQVPDVARSAFDIEFGRQRLKIWVFVALWIFLGNFGGHIIYMWIKKGEFPLPGFFVLPHLLCLGNIFISDESKSAMALGVLTIGMLIHGIYVLASGELRDINDKIAARVAAQVR